MFDKIKKCLDEFESAVEKIDSEFTNEDKNTVEYFDLHLAEAIIEDECCDSKKIAKIILGWIGM